MMILGSWEWWIHLVRDWYRGQHNDHDDPDKLKPEVHCPKCPELSSQLLLVIFNTLTTPPWRQPGTTYSYRNVNVFLTWAQSCLPIIVSRSFQTTLHALFFFWIQRSSSIVWGQMYCSERKGDCSSHVLNAIRGKCYSHELNIYSSIYSTTHT